MSENIQWVRYGFHINHPAVKAVAEQFDTYEIVSVEKGQLLADLMNEIDKKEGKGQWISNEDQPTSWNFYACHVDYRGPNSPNYPTKSTMKNVLILSFQEWSQGPVGRLYIPYNDEV